jgi:hypothetical protein
MAVTLQAKTDVRGLTSGLVYAFRVRSGLESDESTWTQVLILLISPPTDGARWGTEESFRLGVGQPSLDLREVVSRLLGRG